MNTSGPNNNRLSGRTNMKANKRKPNKPLPLEELIKKEKIMSPHEERLLHGKYKWEFLRLNDDFRNELEHIKRMDPDERTKKITRDLETRYEYISDEFHLNWKLDENEYNIWDEDYLTLSPDICFEEQALLLFPEESNLDAYTNFSKITIGTGYGPDDDFLTFRPDEDGHFNVKELLNNENHQGYFEHGLMAFVFDFKLDKKTLKRQFEKILELVENNLDFRKNLARKKHRYGLYPRYLQVYKLRKKNLKFTEIANIILPENTDTKSAEQTIRNDLKEVQRLIKNVANF